jgi:CelD/BcsL family acetyltransferase involved in cellulose biosynthesis
MDGVHREAAASSAPHAHAVDIDVVRVDATSDPRWSEFIRQRPDALVYHHPAWAAVLAEAYGYADASLAALRNGGVVGALPLFRTRGLLRGRQLASLPHTPHAGPIGDDAAVAALLEAAVASTRAPRDERLQIKSARGDLAELSPSLLVEPWEPTFVLTLPERPEEIRFGNSRNHTRIKGKVTAAARKGVRVREASGESDLRAWYRLYLATMRRHAVPPRPYRFFSAARGLLEPEGMMRLLLAEEGAGGAASIIAGSIFLMANATVIYRFNGSRRDRLHLHPNDALQWHAIHDACREGYRRYDFGEVEVGNEGLAMFKSKWGAVSEPLFRYGYPATRELERGALRRGGRLRSAAQAVWRHLPLRATELIGDRLYRHL